MKDNVIDWLRQAVARMAWLLITALIVIAVILAVKALLDKKDEPEAATFKECLAAGFTVMESYPRQCRTPDGRVFIEELGERTVRIFFGNIKKDPRGTQCGLAYPVERRIADGEEPVRAAIEALLRGPSEEEKTAGFFTSINSDAKLRKLEISSGTAAADFDYNLDYRVGGSCRVLAIRAQLEETLRQFSGVGAVSISINGRTDDILQP